jgi:sugar lactone lactonase YvrE
VVRPRSCGNFITKWGSHGGNPYEDTILNGGQGDGEFFFPTGIRIARDTVYVSDSSNNRLQKFDLDGNFISKWGGGFGGGDDEMFFPSGLGVDAQGNVYVTDVLLHRIMKYAP